MKRISLTLDEKILKLLDEWVKSEFELEFRGNRSGFLNDLIAKNTPKIP